MKEIINLIKKRSNSTSQIIRLVRNQISEGLRCSPIKEKDLSIYEAFCVWETSLRINLKLIGNGYVPLGLIIEAVNITLMSKLFSNNDLFNYYRDLTLSLCNANKNTQQKNYIIENICSILNCDIESLELLRKKRKAGNNNNGEELHCDYFPFNFDYETELINVIKNKSVQFNYSKDVSPVICDLIVELELFLDDLL